MILKKIGVLLAGGTLVASLAACDFTAEGQLECHDEAGKIVCTATGTGTPATPTTTTPPPSTEDPPATEEPGGGDPDPVDPNEGLPAATVNAKQSADNKVRVWWSTTRTDITGWHVSRDGVDSGGHGTWGTDLAKDKVDVTFDLLKPGAKYTFTVVGKTAGGNLTPVTASVTLAGVVVPDPDPVDPDPGTTPGNPASDTAAGKLGWGAPVAAGSDEFNGTAVDGSKWSQPGECWPGNATVVAGRCASHNSVQNGYLRETGTADGKTGWVASKFGQKYGRWEVRARVITEQPGKNFHPVLITWPDSNQFPAGAEYDFLEINSNSTRAEAYLHFPNHQPRVQEHATGPNLDFSQWHNYGFEWSPSGVKGFIDGVQWFSFNKDGIQNAPGPMHQTIQLDNFLGTSGMAKVHFDADWARVYPLR